jgi:pimeloyl-ACP methyl ester carboxylesterase
VGLVDGGWTGWATAKASPERVRALIATGQFEPEPESSDEPWEEFDEWIRQLVAKEGMSAVVTRLEEADPAPVPDWEKAIIMRASPRVFLFANTKESWRSGITDLAAFKVPTLLISGEFEDEHGRTLDVARRLAHGEGRILPGVGHNGAFLRSDMALPIVREFLDRFPWP